MGLEWRRYFYRIGGITRSRVSNRNHCDDLAALHDPTRGNDCAGPILATFFRTFAVLVRP